MEGTPFTYRLSRYERVVLVSWFRYTLLRWSSAIIDEAAFVSDT